ncbi:MT-A70-domain-containing protein [Cryphonectria parasitica EP155]|uniref:N6-methyladenosine RNA methyltransferase MTA1 n=1 Tax=Cryphonectria parasitica (strain ATCC 38755 / EP155) TaxID=660469 RepID=MTA1_CRYP1|nr:MT-A70-domain-containing protein [Cryphonectria parasitica EP155]KAF3767598.1 MT-A70-domain-containing protein [Cryphonectria parasitica EP155]
MNGREHRRGDEAARREARSILFQNQDRSIVLIDVPTSIEEAQASPEEVGCDAGPLRKRRRLISSEPPHLPFKTPEPKAGSGGLTESVSDLMIAAAATEALRVLQESYAGPFCLPRVTRPNPLKSAFVPKGSFFLHGTVSSERDRFAAEAPVFDLIVLDPPWPNRSARRKQRNYRVADSLGSIRETLSLIPIAAHLAPDGLLAVWITNKAGVVELLTGPRGLFAQWGLEQVDEWTWLKITTSGEPIVDVGSTWRKPWERILIARRRGSSRKPACRGRVLVSVPDLHSRKPNLRGLFEDVLVPSNKGLEIFARNLTAGWWSWGDEVLKFQQPEYWVES